MAPYVDAIPPCRFGRTLCCLCDRRDHRVAKATPRTTKRRMARCRRGWRSLSVVYWEFSWGSAASTTAALSQSSFSLTDCVYAQNRVSFAKAGGLNLKPNAAHLRLEHVVCARWSSTPPEGIHRRCVAHSDRPRLHTAWSRNALSPYPRDCTVHLHPSRSFGSLSFPGNSCMSGKT